MDQRAAAEEDMNQEPATEEAAAADPMQSRSRTAVAKRVGKAKTTEAAHEPQVAWRNSGIVLAFLRVIYSKEDLPTDQEFGKQGAAWYTAQILDEIKDTPEWKLEPQSCAALTASKASQAVQRFVKLFDPVRREAKLGLLSGYGTELKANIDRFIGRLYDSKQKKK
jgi:hypothetical protein